MTRLIFILLLALPTGIQLYAQDSLYNLASPTQRIQLPEILHEVSGLTIIDNSTFACVQDELGIVFFYNMESKEIIRKIQFQKKGDFEGITEVNNSLYILRSDGYLTEIEDYKSDNYKISNYKTNVPAKDNEGLCYDPANNRLLIGSKSKLNLETASKDSRGIFGFDLSSKELTKNPVFEFDVNHLMECALHNNITFPDKQKKNGKLAMGKLKFKISAIAIHPLSRKLYLVSATDYLLFVFDESGNPELIEQLDAGLFNKAEGITFFDNGDMLVTNEGQDQNPTLLRFNMNKKQIAEPD